MSPAIRQGSATPNRERDVRVKPVDLPLHCPTPDSSLWNSHPRVYIPLAESDNGIAVCPYCGTRYQLVETND